MKIHTAYKSFIITINILNIEMDKKHKQQVDRRPTFNGLMTQQAPSRVNNQTVGGHLVVDRDSQRIKLEPQFSISQSDKTRVNIRERAEGAYLTDATTSTLLGQQAQGQFNRLSMPQGSMSGNTNDSRVLDKKTLKSFKNGTTLNSGDSNIAFDKNQAHSKMNQTVSGISQKLQHQSKSVKRIPSPIHNSYMKKSGLQELQSPPLEQDEQSYEPTPGPNKVPNKLQGPFSKRGSSQQQSEDQSRDIDAWGADGNQNIRADYLLHQVEKNDQQIESSNMSTQGAGDPFPTKPQYAPRRTSSASGTRRSSPVGNDYSRAEDGKMAQQTELMKNQGIIRGSQRRLKGKRKQKSKNSNRDRHGSGGRLGDQGLHRNSIERVASGKPEVKKKQPQKYIYTGGQTYFFGGAAQEDYTKIGKGKQKTAKVLPASDYDTGSQTTAIAKHLNGRNIITDKEIKIQMKRQGNANVLNKNPGLKPQTAESHHSTASPNTSVDYRIDNAQNRFKRKDSQKASTGLLQHGGAQSSKHHVHSNSYKVPQMIHGGSSSALGERQNHTVSDRMIKSRNSHSNTESIQQYQHNPQKGNLNWQRGSRHSLHRLNKSSRNQLDPQNSNHYQLVDVSNSMSLQTLPAVSNDKQSLQADAKMQMKPPLMLNKQSKDFSGTQTFLSAIASSQGMGDADDTTESYKDHQNNLKNQNASQRNQQNNRYRSQGEVNNKLPAGNLLKVQNQILGNMGNGGYNDVQLQKKIAKGGQKLTILQSSERFYDQNGNMVPQPGIFIYRTNDNNDSRRKYQSGYIHGSGSQNWNSKNATIDQQPMSNSRKEDPYRDLSGGRNPVQLQELKSNTILQSKSRILERQQQNPLSSSMDAPLSRGQQQQDEGQRHYYQPGNFTTLDPPGSRSRQFRAHSQQDKYIQEERQRYPPIMTQSQSYQTLNPTKDSHFGATRQSMPNPILKPSTLPKIERAQGNDSALRAQIALDDNYQNKTAFQNDGMKQQGKYRRNQNMNIPKTLPKGPKKRTPMDSDFMLYYKSIKMGGQQAPEENYPDDQDIYNNQYLEETPEQAFADLNPQQNPYVEDPKFSSGLNHPAQMIEEQTEHNETSKFENSKSSHNSQKSTEKMKPNKSEKVSQVEVEQERVTERRGSAGTSKKSESEQIDDRSINQQLRFSLAQQPNKTSYPVTNQAQNNELHQNSLNNGIALQNVKSDPKKDDQSQLNFEDYKMVTGTDMLQQQPSILDTPPMSFSIQQQMMLNSNRTKTALATTQPLAVFEIQPREENQPRVENKIEIQNNSQKEQTEQQTETTLEKKADNAMLLEEQPYQTDDSQAKDDSDEQSSSDQAPNEQLEVEKQQESQQYQKISVGKLAPNKKIHLFASKTSAEQMAKDKQRREHLINLKDVGTEKLDDAMKQRHPEKPKVTKKEKPNGKKMFKAYQTHQGMAFKARHKNKEDIISEQHQDCITVYDESQLGQPQQDVICSSPAKIKNEVPQEDNIKESDAEVEAQDDTNRQTKRSSKHENDNEKEEYSSDDQEEQQEQPKKKAANQLATTIRSHHTNSTAYIVDQMDKIKVEWAILERAQQNITNEKEQITAHMKNLQRKQDKLDQKREIQEERQKLEEHRLQIGHEMMLLEQLKQQLEKMQANMGTNNDATQTKFSLEKASKSLPQIPRSNQTTMKKEQQKSQTNVEQSPQQFVYSFGQDQDQAQVMVIHKDENKLPHAQKPGSGTGQSLMSRSEARHVHHHHSTQDFMMKSKQGDKKKLALEPVHDYSDNNLAGRKGKSSMKTIPTHSKDLNISQSSVELIDNDDQHYEDTPPVEKESQEELTFNKIDVGLDSQMGRIGRKTVGGCLGKAIKDMNVDDQDNSNTQYDGPEEEMENEDRGDDPILEAPDPDQSQISHLSLNINYLAGMKVPGGVGQMFDWADSTLMQDVIVNKYKFTVIDDQTGKQSERFFDETQILQILKKIIQDPAELSKNLDIKQTFKISLQTLAELMGILGQQSGFPAILEKFPDITVENLIKLLVKCRQLILTRRLVFQTLKELQKFQKTVARIRFEIDLYLQESEDGRSENRHQSELYIRLKHRSQELLTQQGKSILENIEILRTKHRLFENVQGVTHRGNYIKNVMCYKKVDAEKLVDKEYQSMIQITKAVGIQIGPLRE